MHHSTRRLFVWVDFEQVSVSRNLFIMLIWNDFNFSLPYWNSKATFVILILFLFFSLFLEVQIRMELEKVKMFLICPLLKHKNFSCFLSSHEENKGALVWNELIWDFQCWKSVHIRSFCVFSPNVGKHGLEKLKIKVMHTLDTLWNPNIKIYFWYLSFSLRLHKQKSH